MSDTVQPGPIVSIPTNVIPVPEWKNRGEALDWLRGDFRDWTLVLADLVHAGVYVPEMLLEDFAMVLQAVPEFLEHPRCRLDVDSVHASEQTQEIARSIRELRDKTDDGFGYGDKGAQLWPRTYELLTAALENAATQLKAEASHWWSREMRSDRAETYRSEGR
ncbi:MAG: hypothetical protein AAF430_22055 [Myxococcota bacterium]